MRTLLVLAALVATPIVGACSIIVGAAYAPSLWHRLTDHTAPTAPVVEASVDIRRGIGPAVNEDGAMRSTSCDDLGLLTLHVAPSTDARTPRGEIGYEVEVVGGVAPLGMFEPEPRTLGMPSGDGSRERLVYPWGDGAADVQEPLDVRIVLRAVDRGGNRSAPSDTIRVAHSGYAAEMPRRDADGVRLDEPGR